MKIATKPHPVKIDDKESLRRLYSSFEDPKLTKHVINVKEESEKLAQHVNSLSDDERKEFVQHFNSTVKTINPAILKQMGVGGVIGGVGGLGVGMVAASVRQISSQFNNPILLLIGATALGIVAGATAPAAANYFGDIRVDSEIESPAGANILFPKWKVQIKANTSAEAKPEKNQPASPSKAG
jgi:hypothetical protein